MPSTKERPPFASYKGNEPYIFISYAHKDSAAVFPELERMKEWGANIWYDEGIDPGNEWPTEIAAAVKNCAFFIYFVSPRSVGSVNCRNEVHLALNHHKQFLSIHLEDTEIGTIDDGIELRIGSLQAILMHKMDLESYERKLRYSLGKMIPANPSPGHHVTNRPLPAEGSRTPLVTSPLPSTLPPPGQLPLNQSGQLPPPPAGSPSPFHLPPPPASLPAPQMTDRRGFYVPKQDKPQGVNPITVVLVLLLGLGLGFFLLTASVLGWYFGVVRPSQVVKVPDTQKQLEITSLNGEKKEGKGSINISSPETGEYRITKSDSLISKGTIPDNVYLDPGSYTVRVEKDGAHLSVPVELKVGDAVTVPDVNHLIDVANSGEPVDLFLVGFVYYEGWGTPQDYSKALEWFTKAADKGSPDAENILGDMYYTGDGVDKDFGQSFAYYQKAADQGLAGAENSLGSMFFDGKGTALDYQQALKWYLKAAKQDSADGEVNVGYMYYSGSGVKQDYATALTWFQKAADQGDPSAENYIGYLYYNGWAVTQDYQASMEWYKKAAAQGYAMSENNIGDLYRNGYGVKQDYDIAVQWYQKGADQGNDIAETNLGYMYENGYGVVQNYEKAYTWYKKAADQGYEIGELNLAYLYVDGNGVEKNMAEAIKLFKKAADQGNADAQAQLKKYQ